MKKVRIDCETSKHSKFGACIDIISLDTMNNDQTFSCRLSVTGQERELRKRWSIDTMAGFWHM